MTSKSVSWHPSVKLHDGGVVGTIDIPDGSDHDDDLIHTLCEISKTSEDDILEALLSMHEEETNELRALMNRAFKTLDVVQAELNAMNDGPLYID